MQEDLANGANDGKQDRKHLQERIALLQDRSTHPDTSCHPVGDIKSTQINLITLWASGNHMYGSGLAVALNGASAVLQLDTGASGINEKVAEKAGIKRIVDAEYHGIGDRGNASGYVGYADELRIGNLKFQGCYVSVIEKKSMTGERGLIGADVFSHYLVDIDFPDGKLKLSELPPRPTNSSSPATPNGVETRQSYDQYIAPEMKSYTPIFRVGHNLLIPTKVNDSPPIFFLVDSGGFDGTISSTFAAGVTKTHIHPDAIVKGINGRVSKVYRTDAVKLQFSHFRHERDGLISFDNTHLSDDLGFEVSGILGFTMLRLMDLKIDYRDGLMEFEFDPDRFH